jgi:hypothetical protein
MALRDSALTLVATIIGSGLVVFVATTAYNVFNQPNIVLYANWFWVHEHHKDSPPRISSYEIIARNVGATQATNLTLSIFFVGNFTQAQPVLYDENVTLQKVFRYHQPSAVIAYMKKLARGATIIIDVNAPTNSHIHNATAGDSLYVSAAYDQGSNKLSILNNTQINLRIFPNFSRGQNQTPIDSSVLALASIVAAITFALAFVDWIRRQRDPEKQKVFKLDLFLILPITIIGTIVILVVFDELVRNSIVPSLFIPPSDVRSVPLSDKIIFEDGRTAMQSTVFGLAIVLTIIIFMARSLIAYLIAELIIRVREKEGFNEIIKGGGRIRYTSRIVHPYRKRLFCLSMLLVGIPIESIIRLFFYNSVAYFSSFYLFLIFLFIDIIRMSVLMLLVTKNIHASFEITYSESRS